MTSAHRLSAIRWELRKWTTCNMCALWHGSMLLHAAPVKGASIEDTSLPHCASTPPTLHKPSHFTQPPSLPLWSPTYSLVATQSPSWGVSSLLVKTKSWADFSLEIALKKSAYWIRITFEVFVSNHKGTIGLQISQKEDGWLDHQICNFWQLPLNESW